MTLLKQGYLNKSKFQNIKSFIIDRKLIKLNTFQGIISGQFNNEQLISANAFRFNIFHK
jgi:hypothetical protein